MFFRFFFFFKFRFYHRHLVSSLIGVGGAQRGHTSKSDMMCKMPIYISVRTEPEGERN